MLDLSLASGIDQLWDILPPVIETETGDNAGSCAIQDTVLGYYWLRYERGDMNLRTCLNKLGRHADSNDASYDCEVFFSLLNRLEGVGGVAISEEELLPSVTTLMAPMKALAEEQWSVLSSDKFCI